MTDNKETVFIVDDDEDIRSSLTRSLSKRGFVVETFDSAQAFLDAYEPGLSGCIILDYGMIGMNGLELQQKLVTEGRALPIVFITGHGGVPESVQAMKAGAVDFLEKPFRTDTLVERIRQALKISAATSETRKKALRAKMMLDTLTTREREIVDMIVSNPSNTTSKEIARALQISPRTVDHHRARILEKMQANSMVELIDLAIASQRLS
ncbi:response regulator [uncultured Roseobacter sp.]|uniref:response regulator transcription factor n=1 Tax=uncultured Roseobacter sp. TaxID=114847 RepID=UPI00262CFA7C|nr:response regulator [uncultured Roseobacter sp.]